MIEVQIPRDLEEYQTSFFLGFSKKHFFYVASGLAIAIPNGIFGGVVLPSALVGLINILIAAIAITPFIVDNRFKGIMKAEDFLVNVFYFFFSPRIGRYEYMDYIAEMDFRFEKQRLEKQAAGRKQAGKMVKKNVS